MTSETAAALGAMEGPGAYNNHAKLPASGSAFALPQLERAVRSMPLDAGDHPVVIANYRSSQGKNSLEFLDARSTMEASAGSEISSLKCST
jgi:hypothetical protein